MDRVNQILKSMKLAIERFPWSLVVAMLGGALIIWLGISAYYMYIEPFDDIRDEFETKPEDTPLLKSSGNIELNSGFSGSPSEIPRE